MQPSAELKNIGSTGQFIQMRLSSSQTGFIGVWSKHTLLVGVGEKDWGGWVGVTELQGDSPPSVLFTSYPNTVQYMRRKLN